MKTRTFGGVVFRCERPGVWLSVSGNYGIYRMMAGTPHEQWEVYESAVGGDPADNGDMIAYGLSMKEAAEEAFKTERVK